MMAVDMKKKATVRAITARMRGDSLTNCRPTRMALGRRSRPSGFSGVVALPAHQTMPEMHGQHGVQHKHPGAARAGNDGARHQRAQRCAEAFMATPFRAMAEGNWGLLTISGIKAENTGQRMAMPMPLANVSASSSGAAHHSPRPRRRTAATPPPPPKTA